jgi:septal ring factor EnvC (AmiA/AmiB activator)
MRTTIVLTLLTLLMPCTVLAQEPEQQPDRRMQLEQQVRGQFLRQVAARLGLTDDQRERVRTVLAEGAESRRDLALESRGLRMDLMQAVRNEDTPMSEFQELLARLEAVRERERAIQREEEEALAGILDARQRAVFLMLRMQFNDRVRRMQMGPPPTRGGGPGPG